MVNIDGYKIKVVYFIKVNAAYNFDTNPDVGVYDKNCPKPNPWKISSDSPAELSAALVGANRDLTGFVNLAGGALGETTGTNITHLP